MNLSILFIEIVALLASFTVLVFGMLLVSPLTFISDYPPEIQAEYYRSQHKEATKEKLTKLMLAKKLIAVVVFLFVFAWIEDMMENGVSIDGEQLYEMEDPRGEFESKVVSEVYIEQFKEGLTKQDATILQMRCDGHSLEEIAHAVGFKNAGAVSKHIQKIAESYETFVSKTYSQFLDEHTK